MSATGILRLGAAGAAMIGAALSDGRLRAWRKSAGSPSPAHWARASDIHGLVVKGPAQGRLLLGRAGRRLVAAEERHSVLVMGPTQSHKTSGFAIPAILEWQGPVVAASVKTDLVARTLAWRRAQGRVWIFDPSRCTGLRPSPWRPLQSARTWDGARRLAHGLTDAARLGAGSLADADFWYAAAAKLLAPLLLAAALSGRSMADVVRWLDEQEQMEVLDALLAAGPDATVALQAAKATWARDERQRSAVYTTAETVVDAFVGLHDPLPGPDGPIEPTALVEGHHTLYLCAPAHEQRRLRPLFSALTTTVLDTAFAGHAGVGDRRHLPLLVVLDEAAHIAPLTELDTLASTAAGHGVQLVTVWQDLAQVTARYGPRAGTVVNNHRVKVFLSGIADPATLEHASALIGEAEHRQRTVSFDGRGGPARSESTVVRRLAPPDALRRMRPGTGVAVSGHLPPIRLRLRPWWRDPTLRGRARLAPGCPTWPDEAPPR